MREDFDQMIETAIHRVNNDPSRENLESLTSLLKEFSDEYKKEYGYVPKIHLDYYLVGLSKEVIDLYRDELPFSGW